VITVSDYSTEQGLRVRITCDTTGTTIQIPADEWEQFLDDAQTGKFNGLAKQPKVPFTAWPEGKNVPG
jgi:hypothetical protein